MEANGLTHKPDSPSLLPEYPPPDHQSSVQSHCWPGTLQLSLVLPVGLELDKQLLIS